jgi:hypothetical protein
VSWRLSIESARIVPVALLPIFALAACDPIVSIAGANFPGWLLCMIVGAAIAALIRRLMVIARLESNVGPLTIFYPSLIAMLAMTVWVLFFNRI